jgi:hypothetical protein
LAFKKPARYLVRMLLRTRRTPFRLHPALPSISCRSTPERSGLVYQHETSLEMRQVFMAAPDAESVEAPTFSWGPREPCYA